MRPSTADEARLAELVRTAEVLAAALLPRWCTDPPAGSSVAPVVVAAGGVAVAAPLVAAVGVELAAMTWGSALVAGATMAAALVVPAARLSLGAPPTLALALARCAPLLLALDLGGGALARHWAMAAAAQVCAPTMVLAIVAAVVVGAHGETGAALGLLGAAAAGSGAAAVLARRAARRLVTGQRGAAPQAMAVRRLALVVGVAGLLLVCPQRSDLPPAAATAAGLATAVWIAGDALAVDARPWLRLQGALTACGASVCRTVGRAAATGAAAAAAVGGGTGVAAAALAGGEAGLRIGCAAGTVAVAALTVLALEPDARAAMARCLVFAAALAPGVAALVGGAPAGLVAATAAPVGAAGMVALARRLS